MDYARFETAKLGDVTDDFYFAAECENGTFSGLCNTRAAAKLHKCISEMGFSPSSRSRVQVPRKRSSGNFNQLRSLKVDQ